MSYSQSDGRRRRILLVAGVICLCVGTLPWLGLGGYAFVVPGWNLRLPRLDFLAPLNDSFLYDALTLPLALLGLIPPLGDIIFFAGEGRQTVRPFVMFLFYHMVGIACLWRAFQRT